MSGAEGRLAVFTGQLFWRHGGEYSTDEAFLRFIEAFAEVYGCITLLVRVEDGGPGSYPVDGDRFRVVELPSFDQFNPVSLWRAWPRLRAIFTEEVPRHSVVWIGGPHVVGWRLLRLSEALGVPCFTVIRQNLVEIVHHKTHGLRRWPALLMASWLERRFRRVAGRIPTFTVGHRMFQAYGGGRRATVSEIYVNLLRDGDIPATLPPRTEGGAKTLLWVGRMSAEKGLPVLIRALAEPVLERVDVVVTLVGSGPQEEALRQVVDRLGLQERVRFAGYVPFGAALSRLYGEATLFVLPSLTEGFPQVLLEAMAAGVPCVVSAVSGIPFFVADGEDGVLVPPGDVAALAAAIAALIDDKPRRQAIANAALEKVRSHSLERERERMVRAIAEQCVGVPGASGRQ